jgi:uncharacterized membrane protein YjjP (DUF1212 family)
LLALYGARSALTPSALGYWLLALSFVSLLNQDLYPLSMNFVVSFLVFKLPDYQITQLPNPYFFALPAAAFFAAFNGAFL